MAGESGFIGEVARQEGDRVLVSLPLVGFPPGFELRSGAQVVIVQEESGLAVRPLTEAVRVDAAPAGAAEILEVESRTLETQPSTLRAAGATGAAQGERLVAFVVDAGTAGAQVVSIRPDDRPEP